MEELVVTTSLREAVSDVHAAKQAASELGGRYASRRDRSVSAVFMDERCLNLIVVGERIDYYRHEIPEPFFFHPSMGFLRAKRVAQGETDPLLQICRPAPGDRILDATLGLGADALVLAMAAGSRGRLVACESNRLAGWVVKQGLSALTSDRPEIVQAAGRIQVQLADHGEYLKKCGENSFDIVYFDPMFRETVSVSPGIDRLRTISDRRALSLDTINEAVRVARKRVVLKERKNSPEFERLGFTRSLQAGKIGYGVIELEERKAFFQSMRKG